MTSRHTTSPRKQNQPVNLAQLTGPRRIVFLLVAEKAPVSGADAVAALSGLMEPSVVRRALTGLWKWQLVEEHAEGWVLGSRGANMLVSDVVESLSKALETTYSRPNGPKSGPELDRT